MQLTEHDEASAFNRHRAVHARVYGEDDAAGEMAGWNLHRQKHRVPFGLIPAEIAPSRKTGGPHIPSEDRVEGINESTPEPELPITHQLAAWSKAVQILDGSEVLVRDVIERELAGVAFVRSNAAFNRIMDSIMSRITDIRTEAIRTAFIIVRDRLGDHPVADVSLAKWAATFLAMDLKSIDMTIRAAVVAGDDPDEIARKIVGSMAQNGVDGVTEFTRLRVAHLGRAAIKASNLRKKGIEIP